MKKILQTLTTFSLMFFSLFISAAAQETTDWIEQNFPYLKRVPASEIIMNDTPIVFIAHHGDDYYVAQEVHVDKFPSYQFLPTTLLNNHQKAFNIEEHCFKFLVVNNSHVCLQGFRQGTYVGYYHPKSGTKFELSSTKINQNSHLFTIHNDPVNNGRYLRQSPARCMELNDATFKCGMYQRIEGNVNKELCFYIYRYDENFRELGNISIRTAEGYGTIYSDYAYVMPEGIKGYTITEAPQGTEDLTLNPQFQGGDIVPAQTALLVKGEQGTYPYYAPAAATGYQTLAADVTDNLLRGTSTVAETTGPDPMKAYKFYKLYYLTDTDSGQKRLGFFWGAEGGKPFKNGANKAYLALPREASPNIRGFVLPQDDVTGIESVKAESHSSMGIYDLNGIKLHQSSTDGLPQGMYIVNGKKQWIK